MATTSTRQQIVTFAGTFTTSITSNAASNASSGGTLQILNLSSGFNTITVPTGASGGGSVPTSVTIVPPSGNATSIILKGITGDTGVRLHNTDPTCLGLDPSTATLGLTAGAGITGVRFIWA